MVTMLWSEAHELGDESSHSLETRRKACAFSHSHTGGLLSSKATKIAIWKMHNRHVFNRANKMPLKIEGCHVAQKAIQESPFRPNLSYREFFQSTASTSRRWRRVIIIQGWQLV